jgi:hypothetical protein
MKRIAIAMLPIVLAAGGCGDNGERSMRSPVSYDASLPAEEIAAETSRSGVAPADIPVSLPKIAYVYEYGFRLPADSIPEIQRQHADLCEKQGPQVCRILDMRQSGAEGDYASGSLSLAVAASRARAFGGELAKLTDEAGGKEISSAITGEDLSKQIVDTEARLRARTVLRDRLMEVLASRKGTVAELVQAERGVAQVNEEIDRARSWLAEMQTRVDFSRVNIRYTSGGPSGGGFMAPIREAVGSIGAILGMLIATIIVVLTVLVPLGLIGWGGWKLFRRIRPKRLPAQTTEEAGEITAA